MTLAPAASTEHRPASDVIAELADDSPEDGPIVRGEGVTAMMIQEQEARSQGQTSAAVGTTSNTPAIEVTESEPSQSQPQRPSALNQTRKRLRSLGSKGTSEFHAASG